MANPSIWAQPEQGIDPAILSAFATPQPHPVWAPPATSQDSTMQAQKMAMPDPGLDLHAGLAKIFPPAPEPTVGLDPNPLHQEEGNLTNKLQADYRKDAGTPWAERSTGSKIGHVFAKVGNIAGDVLAPGIMARIPGTDLNRNIEEQGLARQLNDVTGEEAKNAYTGVEQAKTEEETKEAPQKAADTHALTESEITEHNAQAANLLHPQAKTDFEAWQRQNPGKPIEDWLHALSASKVSDKPDPARQQLVDEYQKSHPGASLAKANEYASAALQAPQRAPVIQMFVPGANGQSTLQTIHPGENVAPGAVTASGVNSQSINTAKAASTEQKAAQSVVDETDMAHQLAREAEAGNAPADVDLALSFFKTIKGAGTGIRFTQQEQNLIRGSRSTAGDLEGIAQKVIGGGQMFTPDQRNKILQVMDLHAEQARHHLGGESSPGGAPPAGAKIIKWSDLK
jgi:hypothetical protein